MMRHSILAHRCALALFALFHYFTKGSTKTRLRQPRQSTLFGPHPTVTFSGLKKSQRIVSQRLEKIFKKYLDRRMLPCDITVTSSLTFQPPSPPDGPAHELASQNKKLYVRGASKRLSLSCDSQNLFWVHISNPGYLPTVWYTVFAWNSQILF